MKAIRTISRGAIGAAALMMVSSAWGAVYINEFVKEERTAGGNIVDFDTREFVELYNSDPTNAVNIENYSLVIFDTVAGSPASAYTFPAGASIPANGYYVVGDTGVANLNHTPAGAPAEMFPDLKDNALVLRNGPDPFSGSVVDAVAYDLFRAGATRLTLVPQEIIDQVGRGYYGAPTSANASGSLSRLSMARYKNGLDTNKNGLDFTHYPITPGASNTSFTGWAENPEHVVPNVDSSVTGSGISDKYYSPYALPRVIEPGTVSGINPKSIPLSPQQGKAIVAWDETGGGNSVYSKDLVKKFDIYAYIDKTPINVIATPPDREYQSWSYGIGSIDPLFENIDPSGTISDVEVGPYTRNGSSGVGWVYNQFETHHADDTGVADFTKLYLVDFGESGNSEPGPDPPNREWKILQEIDLSTKANAWYRLGIDYNSATDQITARFGDDTYGPFTLAYDLIGQFNVGYREGISGTVGSNLASHHPPIFDLFVAGLPGDFNNNSTVDAGDYVIWRKNETANSALPNDNGLATQAARFALWRANFGKPPGSGSGLLGGGAVPEPSAMVLAALGILFVAARRRR